jgi:hypothetical protein
MSLTGCGVEIESGEARLKCLAQRTQPEVRWRRGSENVDTISGVFWLANRAAQADDRFR